MRIGLGYDVHRIAADRELWLGGVKINTDFGLLGHSDADVLIHAICDALLGAACLRDIGYHFPDTDPRYKGIDSKLLLAEVVNLLSQNGYKVMQVPANCVSIKATTTEHLGFTGREEGISAYAVALINNNQ